MNTFRRSTVLPAIFACLLWASAFTGIKVGLPYTTPLNFAGVRFILAGLIIFPFTGPAGSYISGIVKHFRIILIIAILQTFLQYAFFYLGLSRVPASLAAIIVGAQPLFIAIVAHFFTRDDVLTWKHILAYLLGISGIVLVTAGRNHFSLSGEVSLLGIFMLLMVNLIVGFANIAVSKDKSRVPPLLLSSSSLIIGGFMLFMVSIPLEGLTSLNQPAPYFISLAWLSILSATAISIWFTLLKRPGVKVSELNFWKFLIPLAGALLAWIFLKEESPSIYAVAGIFLTALSLLILNLQRMRQKKQESVMSLEENEV